MGRPIRNSRVTLIANITPPVAGVVANFTLVKPTGTRVAQSLSTDSQGQATAVFTLNRKKDIPGVYRGRVVVTIDSNVLIAEASVTIQ